MEYLDFCISESKETHTPVAVDSVYYVFADESYRVHHYKIPDSYVLVCTLSGSGELSIGENSFELNSGDVLLFDASKDNFNYSCSGTGWNFWWFEFRVSDKDFVELPLNEIFSHPLGEHESYLCTEALFSLKLKNVKTASGLFTSLICILQTNELISGKSFNSTDIFRCADEYIRKNLATATVKSTAAELKISEHTLLNVFRNKLNISTVNYINNLRTDMARHLLLTSDLNIQTISEYLGYNDQFIFSKAFKQRFKLSPRQYRQNYIAK